MSTGNATLSPPDYGAEQRAYELGLMVCFEARKKTANVFQEINFK